MHYHNNQQKTLIIALSFIASFMLIEAIGGWLTGSLALLSDAGHMFSDAFALSIALFATILSQKPANLQKTFGYQRSEILIAVANTITLFLIAGWILYEAIQRINQPTSVASVSMLIISSIGLTINIIVAFYLHKQQDTQHNLNMRGAYLHVLSDLLGSIGAIIASLLILFFDWLWADPIISIIISLLVLRSAWQLGKQAIQILMEANNDPQLLKNIMQHIQQYQEVRSIHDVHLWAINSSILTFSCHIVVDSSMSLDASTKLLTRIEQLLARHNILHSTLQIETDEHQHNDQYFCSLNQINCYNAQHVH